MSLTMAAVFLTLLAARCALHHAADQTRAAARFSWGWALVWLLTWCGIRAAHVRVGVDVVSGSQWLCGPVALNLLSALFQRIIAIPTAPRLLVLAAIGVTHLTFAAPMSAFGQPHEGLLVVGAMVAGDLLALEHTHLP